MHKAALFVLLWTPAIPFSAAQGQTSTPVVIGETISFHSNVLQESRSLLVAKPAGYDSGADSYPVIYLLDGETHFAYTSGIAAFLAQNDRMPKMLIVGIASGEKRAELAI